MSSVAPRSNRNPRAVTDRLQWQVRNLIGPDLMCQRKDYFFFFFLLMGLTFPNVFHGLFSRWTCEILELDL